MSAEIPFGFKRVWRIRVSPLRLPMPRFSVSEGLSSLSELTGLKSVHIKKMACFQWLEFSTPCCGLYEFSRLPSDLHTNPREGRSRAKLLVERVTIGTEGIAVDLRNDGFAAIVRDMITPPKEEALA